MNSQSTFEKVRRICLFAPVIPVLAVEDVDTASPLAQALIKGRLPVSEITRRPPTTLQVLAELTSVYEGVVEAGTLLSSKDVKEAVNAEASFNVF